LAIAVGLALGWFLGSRAAAQWRDKFNEAIVNLAAERKTAERVEAAEEELRRERMTASALAARVAAFERGEEERQRAHEAQLAQLKDLEAKLEAKFAELAGKAVEGAHDLFLKRAEERLGHAGKQNEEKLKAVLQPVETTLKRYEEGLKEVERARVGSYEALKEQVAQLVQGNEVVRRETQRLANVMRSSPK
ncbi:MAG: DNA recombination protein RmuC, partial [Pseudomonadota bacterium]|nr:DNA recombination protein RmuC [Pseudomonadota bacterium]